jgi:8-oxo-dGTP pyrophosphatase MutT (NUDIX family)
MNPQETLAFLKAYQPWHEVDAMFQKQCIELVNAYPNFYDRNLEIGHLTGSAWILNASRSKVILVHHRKLNHWFQPGGHAEASDFSIFDTAFREAKEETGLQSIQVLSENIFDIDIHSIPANAKMPEHLHFDIRFLLQADENELIQVSDESNAVQWFEMEEVKKITQSSSILRMVEKVAKV